MLVISALSRDELGREPRSYADLRALAARFAREHLAGRTVLNHSTQLAITLAPDALKAATKPGTPAQQLWAIPALPDMLSSAGYVSRLADGLHRPEVRWLHVFTASVEISDRPVGMTLVVRENIGGQCFFDRMFEARRAPERYRAAGGEVSDDGGPAAARSAADMPPLNIFVGGAADESTERVKTYYNNFRDKYDRNARYLSWQDMDGILDAIRGAAPGQRVNIIAHSYGAHTVGLGVGMMAPTGIHVDRLITIDPVGRSLIADTLRGAVGTWVNVTSDASDPNFSDIVATLGGKGGQLPADIADANYSVDTNHGNFAAMMRAPGPGSVSAEQLLLGSDLPKPVNPRVGETFGGV